MAQEVPWPLSPFVLPIPPSHLSRPHLPPLMRRELLALHRLEQLPRLVGMQNAKYIMFTAEQITAEEAKSLVAYLRAHQ